MDIREPGGRLLARVQRKENMLYVLNVNVTQRANCLAARADTEADGNKSLYLVFVGVVFSQHLGLLLEHLGQQHLGCFFRTAGQQHLDCF
jgi:hypothetical protein